MPGVSVICVGPGTNAILCGTAIEGGDRRYMSDDQGQFSFPVPSPNCALVVANETGFCLAQSRDLAVRPTMVVRKWATIEGDRLNGIHPMAGQRIYFELVDWSVDRDISGRINTLRAGKCESARTDGRGHFVLKHVPPVAVVLHDDVPAHPKGTIWCPLRYVEPNAGEILHINLVTQGRLITGKLAADDSLLGTMSFSDIMCHFTVAVDMKRLARPPVPSESDTPEGRCSFMRHWYYDTENGRQRMSAVLRDRVVEVNSNGTFMIRGVEPGDYRLTSAIYRNHQRVALLHETVHVPDAAILDPLDLGVKTFNPAVNLKVGDIAPQFSLRATDGRALRLSHYRGKFVLLEFWATWCGPCQEEIPFLKGVYDRFGNDSRFVMLGLNLDSDLEAPKKFVSAHGILWNQANMSEAWNDPVCTAYGIYGIPQIMLVGPDGKIVARDLRGSAILNSVSAAVSAR